MSFQHLDDLSRLQVPNVYFSVFAAADNPFPSSYTVQIMIKQHILRQWCNGIPETRIYTIFFVAMTCVCLKTSCGVVIPEPNG
jgi:hypothetical protein